jgi:hypothetical protein
MARKISLELEHHYDEAEHTFAPYHDIVFLSGKTEPEALRIWAAERSGPLCGDVARRGRVSPL